MTYGQWVVVMAGLMAVSGVANDERLYQIDPAQLAKGGQGTSTASIYQKYKDSLGQITTTPTATAPNLTTGSRFNEQHRNRAIAQWSLHQVNSSLPLIDDPWVNQVVFGMTAEMNAQVRSQALLAVPVIQDDAINAFAVPGGLIGINVGTILSANALDEVASVMAHEIAHLSQRHYEHNQDNSKNLIAMQIAGLVAAIAASAAGGGDAVMAVMAGSQSATAENAAAHSREHEREADRVGMQILTQAGYDAGAMPRFFGQLYKQTLLHQSKDIFVPSFVQSHPFTAERLSEASSRAKAYPSVSMATKANQAKLFDKLTWRLKYLTNKATLTELTLAAKHSEGASLALASHLADKGETDKAWALVGRLDSTDPLTCIVQAHVLGEKKDYLGAKATLERCQALYPERRDLRLHLADVMIKSGQPKPAQTLLKSLTANPSDITAWELTQQAFEKESQLLTSPSTKMLATIYALQARSQVELWTGKYQGALQSNAQAQELLKELGNIQPTLQKQLDKDKTTIITARDFKP